MVTYVTNSSPSGQVTQKKSGGKSLDPAKHALQNIPKLFLERSAVGRSIGDTRRLTGTATSITRHHHFVCHSHQLSPLASFTPPSMLGHQGNRCDKLFITPLGTTYHSGFAVGVFVKELELQNNARTQANVIKMHENACNHGTFPLLRPSPSRTSITAKQIDLPIKESSLRDLPAVRSHQQQK